MRGAKIVCVDIDQEAELATNQNVRSVPMLLMFKDGQKIDEQAGLVSGSHLREMLNRALD
jgi:thioredoxin 1